jgi:hypothetical protein
VLNASPTFSFNLLARNCDINTSSFTSLEKSGNLPAVRYYVVPLIISPHLKKIIPSKAFSVLIIPTTDSLNMLTLYYIKLRIKVLF